MGRKPEHDYERIAKLYRSGIEIKTICERMKVTTPTIYRALDRTGVPRREKQDHSKRQQQEPSA